MASPEWRESSRYLMLWQPLYSGRNPLAVSLNAGDDGVPGSLAA